MPGWIIWSVRGTVTAHMLSVLAQAMLAGMFITGDVDLLRMHAINGNVASVLSFFQLIAVILLWRPGRGRSWPIWPSLALFLLEGLEHATGLSRALHLHIPLAMVIFGISTAMTVWAWGRAERVMVAVP